MTVLAAIVTICVELERRMEKKGGRKLQKILAATYHLEELGDERVVVVERSGGDCLP